VASMMRTNSSLGVEEPTEDSSATIDNPQSDSGPLSPFPLLPHQTQPLSEIYYYNEHIPGSQPSASLAPLTSPPPPVQPASAEVPPIPPPSGPLPGHYNQ
jgi:hypothetical protein